MDGQGGGEAQGVADPPPPQKKIEWRGSFYQEKNM
jgi:hypothetical protein